MTAAPALTIRPLRTDELDALLDLYHHLHTAAPGAAVQLHLAGQRAEAPAQRGGVEVQHLEVHEAVRGVELVGHRLGPGSQAGGQRKGYGQQSKGPSHAAHAGRNDEAPPGRGFASGRSRWAVT